MRSASLVRTTRPSMQLLACLKRRVSMTLALSTTSIGAVHMTAMQAVNTGSSLTRARRHGSQAADGLEDLMHQHADVQTPGADSEQGAEEYGGQGEPGEVCRHGSEEAVTQLDVIEEASQHGSEEDDRLEELMGAAPTINLRELRTQVLIADMACTHAVHVLPHRRRMQCRLRRDLLRCTQPLCACRRWAWGPHACMSVHSIMLRPCGAAQVASLPEILSRAQRTAELCARGAPGSAHSVADGSIHSWVRAVARHRHPAAAQPAAAAAPAAQPGQRGRGGPARQHGGVSPESCGVGC